MNPFTDEYHPELRHPRTVDQVIDLARCLQREIRAAWDVYVERVAEPHLAKTEKRIACGPGCDVCCHFFVLVPRYAGVVLAAELVGRGMEDARQRCYAHARLVTEKTEGLTIDEAVKVWTPLRVPCPLLVESKCSVYSARTVTCAGLLALDVACKHGVADQPRETLNHGSILGPLEQGADQLFAARVGVPTGPVPLSVAIVAADELLDTLAGSTA